MLDSQVQEFINNGGEITQVDTYVTADTPKKPNSSYGNRPI